MAAEAVCRGLRARGMGNGVWPGHSTGKQAHSQVAASLAVTGFKAVLCSSLLSMVPRFDPRLTRTQPSQAGREGRGVTG